MMTLARNWWALALRGLVAVIFGLVALLLPGITLAALIIVFGVYSIIDGVFGIVATVRAAERHERWIALLLSAILSIAAGIVAFVWPGLTALALLYVIAFWAIFTGVLQVVAAVQLRRVLENEWMLGIAGVLSVIFGVLLVIFPGAGILSILWLMGAYAIVFGVLTIVLAFRLRQSSEPRRMIPVPNP